jgi:hypothetical protein
MKKLIIVALSAVLAVMAIEPAHAQDPKVLAIIDTAIDSKLLPSSVIYEACFTENKSCPNGLASMEGTGAANATGWITDSKNKRINIVPSWPTNLDNGTYHGYNMARTALAVNPNIKIVFVRYSDITSSGNSSNQPKSLSLAIDWVSKNAIKYSIDALSISQSSITANNLSLCSTDSTTINAVQSLNKINIPTFAATGNNSTKTSIKPVGFPACVSGVIGVGAVAASTSNLSLYDTFAAVTNRAGNLRIVAPVDISFPWVGYNATNTKNPNVYFGSGTSVATAIAASKYVQSNSFQNYAEFESKLVKILGYPYISK